MLCRVRTQPFFKSVTQNGYTAQCSVGVSTSIISLYVSPTSKTLNIGEMVQLTGIKNPTSASEGTQWTSSNTGVATVSNSGLVTAKSAGTATITFKNSASCTVKVINGIKASDIAKKQNKLGFYGEQVTNYKCSNTKGVTVWRIFYADTENIYLIADDYIDLSNAPSKNGKKLSQNKKRMLVWNQTLLNQYENGLQTIISSNYINGFKNLEIINKWLKKYQKNNNYSSITLNNKAVAYMLDTSIWNNLYKGDSADYVIGGPTLEMFITSWNSSHTNKKLTSKADVDDGYRVKYGNENDTTGFANYIENLTKDEYHSIYIKSDGSNACGMWLASPSVSISKTYDHIRTAYYDGMLGMNAYYQASTGFRPIVCLKKNITLVQNNIGYEILE